MSLLFLSPLPFISTSSSFPRLWGFLHHPHFPTSFIITAAVTVTTIIFWVIRIRVGIARLHLRCFSFSSTLLPFFLIEREDLLKRIPALLQRWQLWLWLRRERASLLRRGKIACLQRTKALLGGVVSSLLGWEITSLLGWVKASLLQLLSLNCWKLLLLLRGDWDHRFILHRLFAAAAAAATKTAADEAGNNKDENQGTNANYDVQHISRQFKSEQIECSTIRVSSVVWVAWIVKNFTTRASSRSPRTIIHHSLTLILRFAGRTRASTVAWTVSTGILTQIRMIIAMTVFRITWIGICAVTTIGKSVTISRRCQGVASMITGPPCTTTHFPI